MDKKLFGFAKSLALKIAKDHCPPQIDYDDLIQAAYLGLWEAYLRFDPKKETSVKDFCAYRIKGAVWDELRAEARHLKKIRDFRPDAEEESLLMAGNFDRQILEKAFKSLTPRQELALRLKYLEEMPFSKVAEFLGITEAGVFHLTQRGLFNLRKYLNYLS